MEKSTVAGLIMIDAIDELISVSLREFVTDLVRIPWSGRREREAVSLYSFGYLTRHVNKNKFLADPAQIGMDVAVPQIDKEVQRKLSGRKGVKNQVCKDIVLWPQSRMTCWDAKGKPTVSPSSIMEWKYDEPVCEYDAGWLKQFSLEHTGFVGYTITVDPRRSVFYLSCSRFHNGISEENWLLFK